MWIWEQKTGHLLFDGALVATGYSGKAEGKNNPMMAAVPNQGPIPCGVYRIGDPFDSPSHGPYVLALSPDAANEMFGRGGFLIHGDSIEHAGNASEGCIILPKNIRSQIHLSNERGLTVISGIQEESI